jgi:hypothetical protein
MIQRREQLRFVLKPRESVGILRERFWKEPSTRRPACFVRENGRTLSGVTGSDQRVPLQNLHSLQEGEISLIFVVERARG